MSEQPTTIKATRDSLRLLRLVAAATGEKQYEVLRRLLTQEAGRLGLPATNGRQP